MSSPQNETWQDFPDFLAAPAVVASPRWVRVKFGGQTIADSRRALLLRQYGPGRLPTYYFPPEDVRLDLLHADGEADPAAEMKYWSLEAGGQRTARMAWTYQNPPPDLAPLQDHISFEWAQMEAWYEEEEQIFVHARDPYKRVDVIASSRHVRVALAGQTLAESDRPYLLFETLLPTRYYLPAEDVRLDLLQPSRLRTGCPYKGLASYWSVELGNQLFKDIVWSYPDPIPENPKIKGLMCFFNERVDIFVDGQLEPRPRTPWSE